MKCFFNISLRIKLLLIVTIFFLIPFTVIFLSSYYISEKIILEKTSQATNLTIEQLNRNIERLVDDPVKASSVMLADRKVIQMLRYYNGLLDANTSYLYRGTDQMNTNFNLDKLNIFTEFSSTFSSIIDNLLYPGSHIGIFTTDGTLFSTWSTTSTKVDFIKEQQWMTKSDSLNGVPFFTGPHESYINNDFNKYVSFIRTIKDSMDSNINLGVMVVSIPMKSLEDLINKTQISKISSILVTDDKGNLIVNIAQSSQTSLSYLEQGLLLAMQDRSGSFTDKVNGKESLINYYTLDTLKWKVVSIIPYSEMLTEIRWMRYTVLALSISLVVVFFILTIISIYYIIKPLHLLKKSMEKVKAGNMDVVIQDMESTDEIGVLTSTFNAMLIDIKELIYKIGEDKKRESELRFEMLMAQINPHFLFNTLNSIKWMAIMSRAVNVSETISALGRLLEISMNKQSDAITIKEEIENVKSYVLIQKTRYSKNFEIAYDLDPEIMEYGTLKLILQPLVENAIIHNIEDNDCCVIITIRGKCINGIIELIVEDDGKGIDEDTLEGLFTPNINQKGQRVFKGIGVNNVHERILLKFGADFGISVSSKKDEGSRFIIRFPCFHNT